MLFTLQKQLYHTQPIAEYILLLILVEGLSSIWLNLHFFLRVIEGSINLSILDEEVIHNFSADIPLIEEINLFPINLSFLVQRTC